MRALITSLLVLSVHMLHAQFTPWEPVIIEREDSSMNFVRVKEVDGKIYGLGASSKNASLNFLQYRDGIITGCDSNLENCITNYVEQNQYNLRFLYVDIVKWDNKLVAFMQAQDTAFGYKTRFVLNYFNESTLALDSMYEIPSADLNNRDLGVISVLVTSQNEALVAGFSFRNDPVDGSAYGFVMNLGLDRKIKWFTEFNTSGTSGQVFEVKKYKDSYIVVGNENENIFVARMDTLGNVLWNKTYSNSNIFASLLVDEVNDRIFVGGRDEGVFVGTTLMHYPRLVAMDTNGILLWAKNYTNFRRYDANGIYSLAFAKDSNIIAMGTPETRGARFGQQGYGVQTFIMKLDKSNGDVLFNRCYQIDQQHFNDALTIAYNMISTKDGNIYIGGAFTWGNDSSSIMGFMQKLNSEGCPGVPCNCELGWLSDEEKMQLNKEDLKVYPNPFEHSIRIENADFYPDADVVVTDLSGRTVHQQKLRAEIDLHFLNSGMYILMIRSKNQSATFKISKQ
jgi:hypothetical protein